MKMKFGAIVVDGRGKIGGHVASKNRGGAYLRTKVTPSNPNTVAQAAARARITNLSKAFGSLTTAQINAWNSAVDEFAKTDIFGDIKKPSGLNLFVKLNSNLLEAGQSVLNTPPLKEAVAQMLIASVTIGAGGPAYTIMMDDAAIPANHVAVIRASAQVSPGVSNFSGKMRNVIVKSAVDSANQFDIPTEYAAKFGALIPGTKIKTEIYLINTTTGQKGAISSSEDIVG